jgi:hypothetical protein
MERAMEQAPSLRKDSPRQTPPEGKVNQAKRRLHLAPETATPGAPQAKPQHATRRQTNTKVERSRTKNERISERIQDTNEQETDVCRTEPEQKRYNQAIEAQEQKDMAEKRAGEGQALDDLAAFAASARKRSWSKLAPYEREVSTLIYTHGVALREVIRWLAMPPRSVKVSLGALAEWWQRHKERLSAAVNQRQAGLAEGTSSAAASRSWESRPAPAPVAPAQLPAPSPAPAAAVHDAQSATAGHTIAGAMRRPDERPGTSAFERVMDRDVDAAVAGVRAGKRLRLRGKNETTKQKS